MKPEAKDRKLFFVVGIGRSGTTLIQSMLHAHSEVWFAPETHFVKRYLVHNPGRIPDERALSVLLEKISADEHLTALHMDLAALITEAFRSGKSLAAVFGEILFAYAQTHGCQHAGDKDPLNSAFLPLLQTVNPNAYVIHIIRDPRDVVLSRTKTNWGNSYSLARHIAEYQFYFLKVRREGPVLFGERYIEVKYEDLLKQSDSVLQTLCKSIGLNFEPRMLEYYLYNESLVRKDEVAWKGNVARPVMKENMEKWRTELDKNQILQIEAGFRNVMRNLDYMPESKPELKGLLLHIPVMGLRALLAFRDLKRGVS